MPKQSILRSRKLGKRPFWLLRNVCNYLPLITALRPRQHQFLSLRLCEPRRLAQKEDCCVSTNMVVTGSLLSFFRLEFLFNKINTVDLVTDIHLCTILGTPTHLLLDSSSRIPEWFNSQLLVSTSVRRYIVKSFQLLFAER